MLTNLQEIQLCVKLEKFSWGKKTEETPAQQVSQAGSEAAARNQKPRMFHAMELGEVHHCPSLPLVVAASICMKFNSTQQRHFHFVSRIAVAPLIGVTFAIENAGLMEGWWPK